MINNDNDNGKRRSLFLAALLGTALVAGAGIGALDAPNNTPPPLTVPFSGPQQGFAKLVATVKPAVVNISSTERVKPSGLDPQDRQMAELLRQFLGPNAGQMLQQSRKPTHALGSGFIIDPHGYIVTSNHVIDDASDIQVTLADGSIHSAQIVGRDDKTDVALLKIETARPVPYVAFGNSDREEVGDWVIAVGNPYGLGGSVSAGIVSARNRDISQGQYDDFLQIDAPINPGNSGGPLFDQSCHVIGIDTAIYTPSGGSVGIGFAIPSNVAAKVVTALREHGHVTRGFLGVQMQEVTPELAKAMGLDKPKGALVDQVTPNSPAAHAGLRQGDVILSFNGAAVDRTRDLSFAVADTPIGKTVGMTVWRDGHPQTLNATVGKGEPQNVAAAANPAASPAPVGLQLAPVPPRERDQYGIRGGAAIASVKPGSAADNSGLQTGDVILRVGNHDIASPDDAVSQFHAAETQHRSEVALLVMRNGNTAYVPLQLGAG